MDGTERQHRLCAGPEGMKEAMTRQRKGLTMLLPLKKKKISVWIQFCRQMVMGCSSVLVADTEATGAA